MTGQAAGESRSPWSGPYDPYVTEVMLAPAQLHVAFAPDGRLLATACLDG